MQCTGHPGRIGALRESHPGTLANLVRPFTDLSVPNTPPSAREAEHAAAWAALVDGAEAGPFAGDDDPSPKVRRGWQRSAGAAVDKRVFEVLFAELDSASRALLLSQSGAGAMCTHSPPYRTGLRCTQRGVPSPAAPETAFGAAARTQAMPVWAPPRQPG